jgi:luciferase family oxidoreductase group 1
MSREADTFPQDVLELLSYFESPRPGQRIRAVPGAGLKVPVWLLGSSLFSAQLAASLGLPFAFASHFAPDAMLPALEIYRQTFRPSVYLEHPYTMIGVNVIAAATDREALRLFTSVQQAFTNLRRGQPGLLPPPREDMESWWSPGERTGVSHALRVSAVGDPEGVGKKLQQLVALTQASELMLSAQIFDHAARLRSFELAASVLHGLG